MSAWERKPRSKNQQAADVFDLYLYRLICEATDRGQEIPAWHKVHALLREARPHVRAMMAKCDLEKTGRTLPEPPKQRSA
jgi:hypothetical protein